MKSTFKKLTFLLAVLIVLMLPFPAKAAGSAGISLSKSTVTIGSTVKVTFSFSGGDAYIAGVKAYVSYDSAKLKFTGASGDGEANVSSGSGTIVLETSSTSKSNLSITMSFTTQATGDASVKITGSDIVDWDGNTVGAPTASKTVTIKEKEEKPPVTDEDKDTDKETEKETESSIVEEPSDLETALPVEVNGAKLLLWTSLENVTLPGGFTNKTIVYEGAQVQAAYHEALDLTLLYFTNGEGANGQFCIYDGFGTFNAYQTLTIGDNTYILLMPGEDIVFPEGYVQKEEVVNSENVRVWANPADAEYCYIYAAHQTTLKKALYLYDRTENTLQRVNTPMYEQLILSQQPVEEEISEEPAEELPEEAPKSVIDRILEDDGIMMVMIGVAGVSLLAIVIMASVMIAGAKKRKAEVAVAGTNEEAQLPEEEMPEETVEETVEEPAEEIAEEHKEESAEAEQEPSQQETAEEEETAAK